MADDSIYEITGQTPSSKVGPGVRVTEGVEVFFTIPGLDNTAGSVFVPGNPPDPMKAQDAIRRYVESAYSIAALKD